MRKLLVATLAVACSAVLAAQALAATRFIKVGDDKVRGAAEQDQDRTSAEGKASSVQFVHFPFTRAQIETFRRPGPTVIVGMDHENYAHMAVMPDAVRQELAGDFD